MAFEIPSDLIRNLQLALRREAGVPDYEPSGTEAFGGAFGLSSASHIRCHQCRGELLEVCQTSICVRCGAEQRNGEVPPAISFKSTFACKGFLHFLCLNGSEAVSLEPESSDSSKGGERPSDTSLVLSDLFDLELRWPLDTLDIGTESTTEAPSPSTHNLNLSGVDLDTFFSETAKDKVSNAQGASNEHLNKIEIENPKDQVCSSESFGFSAGFQSSDTTVTAVSTKEAELSGSFANWEAEFQSASPQSSSIDSKSSNFFEGSSNTELVIPMTAAAKAGIEHEKSIKSDVAEPTKDEDPLSSRDSWMQDAIWTHLDKKVSITADQFKTVGETGVGQVKDSSKDMLSPKNDKVQEDLWTSSSKPENNNTTSIAENDELFDDWQDFTCSSAPGVVTNSGAQAGIGTTAYEHSSKTETVEQNLEFGDFFDSAVSLGAQDGQASIISKEVPSNTTSANDRDIFDGWQGFTSSGKAMESSPKSQTDAGYQMNAQPPESEPVDLEGAEFGNYLHLISSSGAHDHLNPSTSQKESNGIDIMADGDDLFDDWQEFTSSGNNAGDLSNFKEQSDADTINDKPSLQVKPLDLQDIGFGDFFQSNPTSGVFDGQKGFSEAKMTTNASVSDRMNGAHDKVCIDSTFQEAADINENCAAGSNADTVKANVEQLLSQMHDLSFMLDDELSIPKKADH